ncbi:MAG: Mur ligase family protein [Micrococcales bacterium]
MLYAPAIIIGRILRFFIRRFRPGGGSALPGLIVSKIAPGLLVKTLRSFPEGIVVVTGSAGKSTTTKMLVAIARAHGKQVFTNPSTANIAQGFYSTIVQRASLLGRIPGELAIFEMDEGHAAEVVRDVKPKQVTILNVVEDQLDRFVEPAFVRDKLEAVALACSGAVILNGDDQNTLLIAEAAKSNGQGSALAWFSVEGSKAAKSLGYAPTYLDELPRVTGSTVVKKLDGKKVEIQSYGQNVSFDLPNRGLHFALDAAAALESAKQLLGETFSLELAVSVLDKLPPVFARGEVREVRGVPVEFILVQNPISMQLNIDNLAADLESVMFAIGRDVHDPSWLWTVKPSKLKKVQVVTGFNCAEAELWCRYSGVEVQFSTDDLEAAWNHWLALPEPEHGLRTVVFSADVMRRSRRMLGFTNPEEVER